MYSQIVCFFVCFPYILGRLSKPWAQRRWHSIKVGTLAKYSTVHSYVCTCVDKHIAQGVDSARHVHFHGIRVQVGVLLFIALALQSTINASSGTFVENLCGTRRGL